METWQNGNTSGLKTYGNLRDMTDWKHAGTGDMTALNTEHGRRHDGIPDKQDGTEDWRVVENVW